MGSPGNNESWLLWDDSARTPAMNMAIDELLLGCAASSAMPILRFYSWSETAASFGYSQSKGAILKQGLPCVRRPTGGGAVYHDNELTYSLSVPAGHPLLELDRMGFYKGIHEAMLPAFEALNLKPYLEADTGRKPDRASLQCFASPSPFDIVCASGKLAGAAQRRTRAGLLQQGSISLSAASSERDPLLKSILQSLASSLSICFISFNPPDSLLDSAQTLAQIKYASESWNSAGN